MDWSRLTPALELRRSTRGEKDDRNRLNAQRVTAPIRGAQEEQNWLSALAWANLPDA
jgi:hypothetical protein